MVKSHDLEHMQGLIDGTSGDKPLPVAGKAGSAIVFDYRLVHRGLANETKVCRDHKTRC